jgi:hypothetical protein
MMFAPFARSDRPAAGLRAWAGGFGRRTARKTWWREILLIGVLYGAYELSRGLGDVDVSTAMANGREIMHLERLWHLDPERVLNHGIHHVLLLAVVASYFYSVMHYLVTPAVLIWLYRSHRGQYGRARTALAISTALGLVGYLTLPTAPPRMLGHSGLRDILADTQHYGWWGDDGSVPKGLGGLTNQFAAMPSLHVGWAVWCGAAIALYARHRWVKALGIAYPIVTTVVVMATGNHYFLDAVAGAVVIAAGAWLSGYVPARFRSVPMGPADTLIDGVTREELEQAAARVERAASERAARRDGPAVERIDDDRCPVRR